MSLDFRLGCRYIHVVRRCYGRRCTKVADQSAAERPYMDAIANEQELIAKAVSGDTAALEKLLLFHHDRLLAHVKHRMPPRVRATVCADDVLQQTYVKVFGSIHRFDPRGEGAFYGWVKVIADRQLMDMCRKRQREKLTDKPAHAPCDGSAHSSMRGLLSLVIDEESIPSQEAMVHELQGAFHLALARMPDDYKQVVTLRYLENRSLEHVAKMTGLSEGAVRGICHRARQFLRQELSRLSLYV